MNRTIVSRKISRGLIDRIKNDSKALMSFIDSQNDGTIIYFLEKLGRLENTLSKEPLLNLLSNQNETIRALVLKNLAKMSDISLLNTFIKYANSDKSTEVRREAVSAIGRLRHKEAIPILVKLLNDNDPKVVMQAIRGLLVFSNLKEVRTELEKLTVHPNELIREVLNKELNGFQYKSDSVKKHDEFPIFLKNIAVHGDVLEVLKYVPDESVHLTFTSPPYYNARDYSIYQSYDEYLRFLEKVFIQAHRITKEGRFFYS
ncbi:type II DNA modification methylase [Candidatus Magnetoovum chiemensis]|nr:type II DNA modification methylase [Candidatus Magnetoovum chiemensis]